jgi:molecular chaperone DnaK
MKADADAHAAEDEKRKALVEVKNIADQMVYTAEKALKDNGDKVADDIKKEVEEKIGDLRKAREGDDEAAIKAASEALSTSMQKIGEAMAKAQPQDAAAGTPPEAGATDAEFKERE